MSRSSGSSGSAASAHASIGARSRLGSTRAMAGSAKSAESAAAAAAESGADTSHTRAGSMVNGFGRGVAAALPCGGASAGRPSARQRSSVRPKHSRCAASAAAATSGAAEAPELGGASTTTRWRERSEAVASPVERAAAISEQARATAGTDAVRMALPDGACEGAGGGSRN